MKKLFLLITLSLFSFFNVYSQLVDDLFQQKNNLSKDYRNVASKYQALQIDKQRLSALKGQSPANMQLSLPFENKQMKLQLKKVKITADNFSVVEALPGGERRTIDYSGAAFYQGKIEGTNSFATISIFDDQVMGIIADDKSNIVLGTIEKNGKATEEYTMYRESDLQIPNPMNCFTSDIALDGEQPRNLNSNHSARVDAVGEPVDVYFECDFKFYQDKGSSTFNVVNYTLGFFNNTALLYANENVKIQVSQISVWTTQDPEAAANLNTTSAVLPAFRDRMLTTSYVGDYAHFLSTRSLGGGIAYLMTNPCGSVSRVAVSAINNTYNNFPTYSWTVEVVTHELGHNLGSRHTHSCLWPGGPIDWCGPTANSAYIEGSCTPATNPPPSVGGTIMSYCHLISTGINFNNGFGPLPGQAIRDLVAAATCFGNCRMTISIAKNDASCGQPNGSATVTATNGTGALTYLWSNGQTGATLTNVAPGTYHVKVSDASGCSVMDIVTIANSGSTLTLSLTPNGTTGFCTGGSINLVATNNAAYTYVWKKDGNTIAGATTNTYLVTSGGNYSVTASSGACSATQSVLVSQAPVPTANITPGGPTTFCDGNNVVLNGNAGAAYTYQWYKNAAAISGATNGTYTATTAGNYTVKVSAGTACEVTSSQVAVTVNASPTATVTTGSATSFCAGGNVVLNASTGTGYTYQWYNSGNPISGATQSTYTANASGNYTIVNTLGVCSKTSAATNVVVWVNPTVTVTPTTVTIEKFQNQVLTGNGAATYNWDIQPALVSAGTNTATFKPLTTTSYTIQGTDVNGCKGTATATIIVIGCGDVTNITATTYSPSRAIIRWTNPQGATTDTLQYRKVGTTIWTRIFVTGQEQELNGLSPNTDYEYYVIPLCNTTTVYIPSPMKTFKTVSLDGKNYVRLYPNPVTSVSKLEIITETNFTLQINLFDNAGKKVRIVSPKESLPAGQVIKQINPATLQNGIYHLAVTINGETQNVRLVIMH